MARVRSSIDSRKYKPWGKKTDCKSIDILYSNREVELGGMWIKCMVVGVSTSVVPAVLMLLLAPLAGSGTTWVKEGDCRPW